MPDLDARLDRAIAEERKAHGRSRARIGRRGSAMAADQQRQEQALQRIMAEEKRRGTAFRA